MKPSVATDLDALLAHNRRALARAISRLENGRQGAAELHAALLPHCGRAHVVGITGAPGAGKSTLINALLGELLRRGRRVAVVAVDPSSPISGGAILGDRVRMSDHDGSDEVFIRSVSSRGHLGGLSRTTGLIIDLFDAAGYHTVIVETVGTGQSEVEISRYADTRIVVCPPGLGDEVQAIKAGILEIADILVVNKGDQPQAQRTKLELLALRGLRHPAASGWQVPVLRTVASSGEGVSALVDKFEQHARIAGIGQRLKASASGAAPSQIFFGEFASDAALGITLAHTLSAGARKLKKGRVLDADDIAALQEAGIESVSGARLQTDDLTEDAAAAAVAALLAGEHAEARRPYTGRCNLHAGVHGVLLVDAIGIQRANRIDEAITIGTLPPWTVVRQGQVIATVKIIPFGVNRHVLDNFRRSIAAPPLAVAALQPHRAALILSQLPGIKESLFAAATSAVRNRLEALGSRLALELRCPHRQDALESALRQALAAGCDLILISGATITKDRGDVAPAAIVAAGGRIERFGMPVEPGNMLLLARIGAGADSVPVIVLPGCARSRRLNGLDWVLQRLLAKLPLSADDIAALGVGGLIRHAPSGAKVPTWSQGSGDGEGGEAEPDEAAPPAPSPRQDPSRPRIAALVLAAGRSTRMGGSNKLLAEVAGVPLALRAVNAALASRACGVTVVTGFEAEKVEALVAGPRVALVRNPDYAEGMSTSLRRGIAALPADVDGVVVLLADMPHINAAHIDALIEKFAAAPGIVVPMHDGRRGNPVLWPRSHFAALQAITGDQGARELLSRHAGETVAVEIADAAIFADVDTPEDLAAG